jgi:hypothetical protein
VAIDGTFGMPNPGCPMTVRDDGAVDHECEEAMAAFQGGIEDRDRAAAERILDDEYALELVTPAQGQRYGIRRSRTS